ncbi:ABC transporter ATP-binding protein [Peptoniphilus lacydonensis]|uniref:ABC transporter ATP-binding protein n=1 Tax=Peptoniphilus lacydonensis TaxID=1673725 RepID=UPI002910435A|nr:ABC transporter ATP-binding protein [Peptoniphilus lacydonensis]MBS6610637.1 ABC transporter ATP-binding protein [Peptoniphilus harei]MDU5377805.1 ABC transporter ATP-binding protein [Peptoniphilus lacydonensis]MDU5437325.1 ABC transporter ATP-binding protein [Peptoniphilus lacydonensis]
MSVIIEYKNLIKKLLKLVRNLKFQMIFAILFGAVGHIFATLLPSLGIYYLCKIILNIKLNLKSVVYILFSLAIFRVLFRYFEQLLNHYIAFKILAEIRDKVFKKLRKLGPAKMDCKNKGELISIITSDIELLEVFYAHTISPVCIALIHTLFLFILLWRFSPIYSLILLVFHLILAIYIPIFTEKSAGKIGMKQRKAYSSLNSLILETFKGIKEIINFSYFDNRYKEIEEASFLLNKCTKKLSEKSSNNFALSSFFIIFGDFIFILTGAYLYRNSNIDILGILFSTVLFISSFGPTSALSSLANNLVLTFASGKRVIDLLEEEPITKENVEGENIIYDNISLENIKFSYDDTKLIEDFDLKVELNQIIGLKGKSGCGKSTLIKLIMRFFDVDEGKINFNEIDVKDIKTKNLRENISYLSQETYLFKGSIRDNLKIAKKDVTEEELIKACKKANIYDFIMTLENGFDTEIVKENNEISTGQAQRLSLARIFLRESNLYLLDEPTANIDALNEGIILKSLYNERGDKTIIISSHRDSSLRICNKIVEVKREMES